MPKQGDDRQKKQSNEIVVFVVERRIKLENNTKDKWIIKWAVKIEKENKLDEIKEGK